MGIANRDASQLTMARRNRAQNSYSNDWKNAIARGVQVATPPARTSAEVVTEIKLGCVSCFSINGNDLNQPRYRANPSSSKNTGTS
jgi:hypothetical protein